MALAAAAPVYLLLEAAVDFALTGERVANVRATPPEPLSEATAPEPTLDFPARSEPTPVAAPQDLAVVAEVVGTLRTPDGTPVPGEAVELESRALELSYLGTSDAHGGFAIPNVGLGSDYEVRVLTNGRYRNHVQVDVAVPPEGLVLDLVVEPLAGARLAGCMVDAEGAPIPDRSLLLQGSHDRGRLLQLRGDDRGCFAVENAPTGRLTFRRAAPHIKVRGPVLVPGSQAEIHVVLDEGSHELGGRVVGDHDVPVAGARLELSWSHEEGESVSSSARTTVSDAQGAFRFTALGPGPHRLAVHAEGYEDLLETYGVFWNSGAVELQLRPTFR